MAQEENTKMWKEGNRARNKLCTFAVGVIRHITTRQVPNQTCSCTPPLGNASKKSALSSS